MPVDSIHGRRRAYSCVASNRRHAQRPQKTQGLRSSLRFLLSLLLILAAETGAQDRPVSPIETTAQLFARGYEALKAGPAEALPIFQEIVQREPANTTALRQLGSIYLNLDRRTEALEAFERSEKLLPSDTTRLQLAYIYNALGNNTRALALFGLLVRSRDPEIAGIARRAIDILTPLYCGERGDWWTRVVGSVYYDHRFEDVIASLSLQAGRELISDRVLSAFGGITVNKDSRSTGGLRPVIYSDNYALAAVGLRFQPTRWWTIDIQPGITLDLLDRPGGKKTDVDFRALTSLGGEFSAPVLVSPALRIPCTPFVDAFLSAGYYSRYTNVIGYSQARAGLRTLAYRHSALDLYVRGDFTFDALPGHREFYNNTVEGSVGARIVPDYRWGVGLLIEFHRGFYWMAPPAGSTHERWYNSFRVLLVIDRYLCL